jgi:hypothetical protein
MEALIIILGTIAVIPAILFYTSLSWGFVVFKFYGWFILSIFPQLPQISILYFIGIMFFLSALFHRENVSIKKEYTDKTGAWTMLIISPWLTLLCGSVLLMFY